MNARQQRAASFLAAKGVTDAGTSALVEFVTGGRLCRLDDCTDTDLDRLAELAGGLGVDVHIVAHPAGHQVVIGTPLFGGDVA